MIKKEVGKTEEIRYELIQTHKGYTIRKPQGKFYLYVSKEHKNEYTWVTDHTYAKKFKLETALRHIEILKGKE